MALSDNARFCLVLGGFWCFLILLSAVRAVISSGQAKFHERKLDVELCQHGIKGGKTRLRCERCKQEEAERLRQEQENWEHAKKIKGIMAEAGRLRNEELARLTKLRTHKIDFLLNFTPGEFEGIVAKMYRQMGYSVKQTPMSNDFGRDLILSRNGKTIFVECKRYARDKPIGRPALQKFYAAIKTMKADSGIFVTTSEFAATAMKFAEENSIELIDGPKLAALMMRAFPTGPDAQEYRLMCPECGDVVVFDLKNTVDSKRCRNGHELKNDLSGDDLSFKALSDVPYCDKCGEAMRLRHGYRGKFWGCKNYPRCRGTKPYLGTRNK